MTNDDTQAWLASLSSDQLQLVQDLLDEKIREKEEARKKLSLRSSVSEIADAYDLDITALQREIFRKT